MSTSTMSGTALRLLGGFELSVDRRPVPLPTQAQRVVCVLALSGTARRESLAGRLWPFSSQTRAHANLRTALWRIRQASPDAVDLAGTSVDLAEHVDVDVRHAGRIARCLIDPDQTAPLGDLPLRLLNNDLLPDWDEEWLIIERERMRQLRIHVLESLSRRLRDAGRFAESIDAALCAVAAEPLRESAHLEVVETHLAEGNVGEASRAAAACRRLMLDELGLEPSVRMLRVLALDRPA